MGAPQPAARRMRSKVETRLRYRSLSPINMPALDATRKLLRTDADDESEIPWGDLIAAARAPDHPPHR